MNAPGFVEITLGNGAKYFVREDRSGIVKDADGNVVDAELVADLMSIQIDKLLRREVQGRC